MQGLKIIFNAIPEEGEWSHSNVEEEIKELIKKIASTLIKEERDFQLYRTYEHEKYGPVYISFTVIIKYYEDEDIKKIRDITGTATTTKYQCCQHDGCYNIVTTPKPVCPLLKDGVDGSFHEIHDYCVNHISQLSRRLMQTLETIRETPGRLEDWRYIHVWKWPLFYVAQRVTQEHDYGDWEAPHDWECLVETPWFYARTKEEAIEKAKKYKS